MAIEYKDIISEQLPATDTTLYTVPNPCKSAHIQFANATNKDSGAVSITVNIVQSGEAVATSNQYLIKSITADGTDSLSALINCVLKPGDFISAISDTASAVNMKLSIKEIY